MPVGVEALGIPAPIEDDVPVARRRPASRELDVLRPGAADEWEQERGGLDRRPPFGPDLARSDFQDVEVEVPRGRLGKYPGKQARAVDSFCRVDYVNGDGM